MASEWYCLIDGKEYGPATAAQLRLMAQDGRLTQADHVRKRRTDGWVPAARVRGLFDGDVGGAAGPASPADRGVAAAPPPAGPVPAAPSGASAAAPPTASAGDRDGGGPGAAERRDFLRGISAGGTAVAGSAPAHTGPAAPSPVPPTAPTGRSLEETTPYRASGRCSNPALLLIGLPGVVMAPLLAAPLGTLLGILGGWLAVIAYMGVARYLLPQLLGPIMGRATLAISNVGGFVGAAVGIGFGLFWGARVINRWARNRNPGLAAGLAAAALVALLAFYAALWFATPGTTKALRAAARRLGHLALGIVVLSGLLAVGAVGADAPPIPTASGAGRTSRSGSSAFTPRTSRRSTGWPGTATPGRCGRWRRCRKARPGRAWPARPAGPAAEGNRRMSRAVRSWLETGRGRWSTASPLSTAIPIWGQYVYSPGQGTPGPDRPAQFEGHEQKRGHGSNGALAPTRR